MLRSSIVIRRTHFRDNKINSPQTIMLANRKKSLSTLKQGYTLVEIMIAAAVLSIVGLGTVSGLLQARKMTEGSIRSGTATTIAQGYLEQMKNMDFTLLDVSPITELRIQGTSDTLTVSPLAEDPETGGASDIENVRSFDLNNTPNDTGDDLVISFILYVDNITNEANGVGDTRRIILRHEYTDNTSGANRSVSNTLYSIRSNIPTF